MALTSDEMMVRAALEDATVGQPAMPVDRVAGVRRRHTRRRQIQGAVAAAGVAVVAVGVIAVSGIVGGGSTKPEPLGQPKPTAWQLPWPTRVVDDSSGEALPTLLVDASPRARAAAARSEAEALAFYARTHGGDIRNPRALFVGTLDNTSTRWVVLEASVDKTLNHQLLAFASTDGGATWSTYTAAPPRPSTLEIGFAVPTKSAREVLVIAAPRARSTGFVDLSSGRTSDSTKDTYFVNGVTMMPVPHRITPGTVFVVADREDTNGYPVLFPEGTPQPKHLPAWQQSPTGLGRGYDVVSFMAGSGSGNTATFRVPRSGTLFVSITCAGPAPARLTVIAAGRSIQVVQHRCDGDRTGGGSGPIPVRRGDRVRMSPSADPATALSVVAVMGP